MRSTYELLTRDQAGALALLDDLGALDEIRQAVVGHYTDWQHAQPDVDARKAYKPQALKARLAPRGWRPEIRVPPFSPAHDALPINERYDAFKIFHYRGHQVGVAVEMEDWQIANDLLKFRRGFERGQIAAGVIIQPSPETLIYCYEHVRHINEPLFGHIPILFCCPIGPGLAEPPPRRALQYGPFVMPKVGGETIQSERPGH